MWCQSAAARDRAEVTARDYRRFRRRDCGRQFNERPGGELNLIVTAKIGLAPYRITFGGSQHGMGLTAFCGDDARRNRRSSRGQLEGVGDRRDALGWRLV